MLIKIVKTHVRKLLVSFIFLTVAFQSYAQSQDIYLIVRADDMGFTHTVNNACIDSYTNGIARSVEVMAATPWFEEAVAMLKEHPDYDVGIHLDLTSEWTNLKWRPLTKAPSLTDENGYFHPFIWKNDIPGATFLLESDWKIDEVEAELRAQIELVKRRLPRLSHFSGHMGVTHMDPKVQALVKRLAKEYGIDIEPEDYDVKSAPGFGGSKTTVSEKVDKLVETLEGLGPGIWLFVDHPGYDTKELEAVGHVGYENVAEDRAGVTAAFTDERVKAVIKKRGIKLISYKDLKNLKQ